MKKSKTADKAREEQTLAELENPSENQERRTRLRFSLNTELRFTAFTRGGGKPLEGAGIASNMSSKGLAFHTATPLDRGVRLRISMAWPAKLDNECALRIVFEGTVVRTHGDLVVLTVEKHDFRTSGKHTEATSNELMSIARSIEMFVPSRMAVPL